MEVGEDMEQMVEIIMVVEEGMEEGLMVEMDLLVEAVGEVAMEKEEIIAMMDYLVVVEVGEVVMVMVVLASASYNIML